MEEKEKKKVDEITLPVDSFDKIIFPGKINFPVRVSIDKKIEREEMGRIDLIFNDDNSITLRPHPKTLEGISRDENGFYSCKNVEELYKVLHFFSW